MKEPTKFWNSTINKIRINPDQRIQPVLSENQPLSEHNIYELSESIILREKKNTKTALKEFWNFKNNLDNENNREAAVSVDRLIDYYQGKMDTLRDKEETLVKISRDSQNILREKNKKDQELGDVRNNLQDAQNELAILQQKIKKLNSKRDELEAFSKKAMNSLASNEKEIIEGITNITLQDIPAKKDTQEVIAPKPIPTDINRAIDYPEKEDKKGLEPELKKPEEAIFPRSVVKTTAGTVIGEYFYDPEADKSNRQYVLNGRYLFRQLENGMAQLEAEPNDKIRLQLVQMASDSLARVSKKDNIHVEVSTNEILNPKTLPDIIQLLKIRNYEEVRKYIRRYNAKVEALGPNYNNMLREQMKRLRGK